MYIENKNEIKEVILSVLFVAGEGVEIDFIAEKLSLSFEEVKKELDELKKIYSGDNGIHLITFKNKAQLSSNPRYADYISEVLNPIREKSLTRAALETLAIIAYKQPITKLEIEDIRRVNCDYAVQILSDQNMIEVIGRKDAVGKPLLFATTETFLKRFNLNDLAQLPDYEGLLEKIRVIEGEEKEQTDSLFGDTTVKFEDDIPEFLQGEDLEMIEADEESQGEEIA